MTLDYLTALADELAQVTATPSPQYAGMYNMFHYHLGWKDAEGNPAQTDAGKRLRPLLCLWSCEAVGGDWRTALPSAAAVELIHNFSLIHDDIEDDSSERRGRPTVWHIWGLAQGINAGDAMFVLAHHALARQSANLSLDRFAEIHRVFDRATLELTQGQYLDMGFERADQVTVDQYLEMVGGKTAALIQATCEMGARIGTTDAEVIRQFALYGRNLGIAFQIADDLLGLWGDPALTGKSARTDLISRKKSYPVLAAMSGPHGNELRALYAKADWSEQEMERVETLLEHSDARTQTVETARSYAARALVALNATGLDNPAAERLRDLIEQVVHRDK